MHRLMSMNPGRHGVSARLLLSAVLAACALVGAGQLRTDVAAAGNGPEFLIGSPALSSGQVQVPIYAWLQATDPYIAFNVHLRWNPSIFAFTSASAAGGVFDPVADPSTGFCVTDSASQDPDGGGVVFACTGYTGTTSSYHLLAALTLSPQAAGCSGLHLFTFGGSDSGGTTNGTFTVNSADDTAQSNAYRDGTANNLGQTCTPPARTSPGPHAPAPTAPSGGNCTFDVTADGVINLLDIAATASVYHKSSGDSGWNGKFDVNADDTINILDLSMLAGEYGWAVAGCTPGYPYYPTHSWNGTLPNGYAWTNYLLFLHAMTYRSGNSCPWVFVTDSGGDLTTCDATARLETLATAIHNAGLGSGAQVFVGPNDCTDLFTQAGQAIATAAGILVNVINDANTYSQSHGLNVVFYAEVDDEAYRVVNGFCGTSNEPYQYPNTETFFTDYRYEAIASSALVTAIGPAGAPQMTSSDQENLSSAGGGQAIPQVYSYFNAQSLRPPGGGCTSNCGCTIDGHGPADGSWPYTIANGYAGIQSDFIYGNHYTSWQGNIRWSVCHDAAPGINFDWYVPGGRG